MSDTVKSASISNLDGNTYGVITANSAGVGGSDKSYHTEDFGATTTAGLALTTSTYKLLRLPTTAKLQSLYISADAALDTSTGLALDVGAYYSDSTTDGTPAASTGTLISASVFAAAITGMRSSALGPLWAMPAYPVASHQLPLWKGLGLSKDPGGFIDIVVAVHTAATTGSATNMCLAAEFSNY